MASVIASAWQNMEGELMVKEVVKEGDLMVHKGEVYKSVEVGYASCRGCEIRKDCEGIQRPTYCSAVVKRIWVKDKEIKVLWVMGGVYRANSRHPAAMCLECDLKGTKCGSLCFTFRHTLKLIPQTMPIIAPVITTEQALKSFNISQKSEPIKEPLMNNPCAEIILDPQPKPIIATAKEIKKLQRIVAPYNLLDPRSKDILREALDKSKTYVEYYDGKEWSCFKTDSKKFAPIMVYRLTKGVTFEEPKKIQLVFPKVENITDMKKFLGEVKATVFRGTMVVTSGYANRMPFKTANRHVGVFTFGQLGLLPIGLLNVNILAYLHNFSRPYTITFENVEILPKATVKLTVEGL